MAELLLRLRQLRLHLAIGLGQGQAALLHPAAYCVGAEAVAPAQLHGRDVVLHALPYDGLPLLSRQVFRLQVLILAARGARPAVTGLLVSGGEGEKATNPLLWVKQTHTVW